MIDMLIDTFFRHDMFFCLVFAVTLIFLDDINTKESE
jgi:hypothetical protein